MHSISLKQAGKFLTIILRLFFLCCYKSKSLENPGAVCMSSTYGELSVLEFPGFTRAPVDMAAMEDSSQTMVHVTFGGVYNFLSILLFNSKKTFAQLTCHNVIYFLSKLFLDR